jgi:hypothetical protein
MHVSNIKKEYLNQNGFKLIEDEVFGEKYKIKVIDDDGYKYFLPYHNIRCNIREERSFDRFGRANIFCLENVKRWLNISKCKFKLVKDFEYTGVEQKLFLVDTDGYFYSLAFCHLRANVENGKSFNFVDKGNPYSIDNIVLYLKKLNKTFHLLDGQEYISCEQKLMFHCDICNEDDPFLCSWSAILSGTGCHYCSGQKVGKYNNFEYKFPEESKHWDYIKNFPLKPSDITYGSNKKYYWICPKCKEPYEDTANARRDSKSICKFCSSLKPTPTERKNLFTEYPSLMEEWDWEKNDAIGLDPHKTSLKSGKKAFWICKNCNHSWETIVAVRTGMGCGCPVCNHGYAGKRKRARFAEISNIALHNPELINEWSDLNELPITYYTYGAQDIVYWKCLSNFGHPDYPCRVANRTVLKRGCPSCSESHGEKLTREFLKSIKEKYDPQHTFDDCKDKRLLKFDFYLINRNFVIEVQGHHHYFPVDFASK